MSDHTFQSNENFSDHLKLWGDKRFFSNDQTKNLMKSISNAVLIDDFPTRLELIRDSFKKEKEILNKTELHVNYSENFVSYSQATNIYGLYLFRFLSYFTIQEEDFMALNDFLSLTVNFYLQLTVKKNQKELTFWAIFMLHVSRAFIDSTDFTAPTRIIIPKTNFRLLDENTIKISWQQLITDFELYFQETLKTKLIFYATEQALEACNFQKSMVIEVLEIMKKWKIIFFENGGFSAMCGLNFTCYMDVYFLEKDKEIAKTHYLLIKYHEIFHGIIIYLLGNDMISLTPRTRIGKDNLDLEAGFVLGSFILGNLGINIEKPKFYHKINNIEEWNQEKPLFEDQDYQEEKDIVIIDYRKSGFCDIVGNYNIYPL